MSSKCEPRSGFGLNELLSRLPVMRPPGQPLKRRKITCVLQCCGPGARAEGKGLRPARIDKHIRALAGDKAITDKADGIFRGGRNDIPGVQAALPDLQNSQPCEVKVISSESRG